MRFNRLLIRDIVIACVFLLLGTSVLYAQSNTESEPNDRFGEAQPIFANGTVTATIAPEGDRDWFAFAVDHHGELRVDITDVAPELAVVVRVWDANRDTVTGWFNPLAPGGDTSAVVDLPAPGRYVLEIAGEDNSQTSAQPYSLATVFTRSPDQSEPNNRFGQAATLDLGQPVQMTILPARDQDWLAVDVDHHGELRVAVTDVPGDLAVSVRVWNANRDTLTSWFNPLAVGGDTIAIVDLPEPGRYVLELVGGDTSQRSIEPYNLQVDFTPSPDENEPNNRFGQAAELPLGQPVQATLLPGGDQDWFSFVVDHHGQLDITISDVPEGMAVGARVWNSNRDTVTGWYNPLASGGNTEAVVDLAEPGRYYLELAGDDNNQRSVNSFIVQATFTAAADAFEPNGSFGTATPFAMNRSALINLLPGGDVDWFMFDAEKPGEWTLQALDVPANLAISLRVWNSNRDTITSWFKPLALGGETNARVDIGAPGRYYVEIAGGDNSQRAIEPFFFKNSFIPAADISEPNDTFETAAPIDLDETVPGNILPAGDQDWCIFDVPEASDLHITIVNGSPDLAIRFRLWDSEKTTISNWFSPLATGGNTEAIAQISEPGTYYLEIADNSSSARSIEPYYLRMSLQPIAIEDVVPPASAQDEPAQESDEKVLVQTSGTVGPAGATLIVNNTGDYEVDGARLQVPADALPEVTTISVGTAADVDLAAPFGMFPAGQFWRLSPTGLGFQQPVSLTLPLPLGATSGEYFVSHWNGQEWMDLGGAIEGGFITAQTEGFSTFGVFCGSFDQYVPVQLANDSSVQELTVKYLAGPAPIPDDPATQYATNCRPPMGNDGQLVIKEGESASLLLRAGAYAFSVASNEIVNPLTFALPSDADAQTITVTDQGASSDDPGTTVSYAGQAVTEESNLRPTIACTAQAPEGGIVANIDPGLDTLPSRFVQVLLRQDHLPPIADDFRLVATVSDPEGASLRPYWTFGYPGTLPYIGQPVSSGDTLGDDIKFQPDSAGVYRIYLTVYDDAELFAECRWDLVVEPNTKPEVNVFSGRTHVAFGRLDEDRAFAGPIPFVAAPGVATALPVPSLVEGASPVVGDSNTLCPSAILGPFTGFPEPEAVVPTPAPVDQVQPAGGTNATPWWPYPGRTCVWATPADADLDPLFVRWEFPRPYFGAGTFFATMAVPAGFHPDAPDGLPLGVLLRSAQQLNAYNAYMSMLYNTFGLVPSILWEAWDDPCLTGQGGPAENPCESGISRGGVTNIVAHTTDGFDKERLGFTPISVGPEGFQSNCADVFFMTLTPTPSNPGPGEDVIVKARLSPIIQNCPVYFTIVGTDGYANTATLRTNKDGEARFAIPGASQGTEDVVTAAVVKEDDSGVVDTETEVIQMEVTYVF
jgi:hypothetical protein